MDINRLHYFCTVAQVGSLSKASELLNISQPALSKAIKTIENELDKKLIIPSGRGISITDEGKQIVIRAVPLIEQINELALPSQNNNDIKTLSIATFEVFSTYFLSKVISDHFIDSKVKIFELVPGPMEDSIASGAVDIGITYLPVPHKELDFLKITSIKMGIYGLKSKFKNHPFDKLPFTAPNVPISGTPSKAKGLDGWPDHLIPRNIKYQVTMMETALDLCRRGCCVGYFPQFVVDLHNSISDSKYKLDILKSPKKLGVQKFDVYMIKRKSDLETSNFKKISRALRVLDK
jgi:DNA-binding transcriptional LysR family regulator